ncbi:MAG: hypothetical protein DMG65_12145 [Candidatus Angelobacter sp. Gp1-AA117]|nr:MAG: hypothetical protein DMG65_12145 [Candidatus Angelobacter sp. Gp1-AA117]
MQELQNRPPAKTSKTGSEVHLILQKRDLELLRALSLLRIIDRNQTAKICGFNSTSRVNTRLLKLSRAGILKRFFFVSTLGGKKAIYCLSKKGAELIGTVPNGLSRPSDSFLIGDKFVAHQLAINEVYCAAHSYIEGGEVRRWQVFKQALSPACPVIPDAYFEIHSNEAIRPMYLEVDLGTEGIPVWNKKVKEYLGFAATGEFERLFGHSRFGVLVVTSSERRMQSLREAVGKLTSKLFYFTTLENLKACGFWQVPWLRPEGGVPQSLI